VARREEGAKTLLFWAALIYRKNKVGLITDYPLKFRVIFNSATDV
jgi:hypothetical protein